MDNHSNGQGNSHDDSHTEGNKQYYPKGWWIPLVGLVTIALGFTLIGGFVLRASGTDKWGHTEQCDSAKCCNDPNCKGDKCGADKKCDANCMDKKGGDAGMMNGNKMDSGMAKGGMKDSMPMKPAGNK
jgi:hypothetical protein